MKVWWLISVVLVTLVLTLLVSTRLGTVWPRTLPGTWRRV